MLAGCCPSTVLSLATVHPLFCYASMPLPGTSRNTRKGRDGPGSELASFVQHKILAGIFSGFLTVSCWLAIQTHHNTIFNWINPLQTSDKIRTLTPSKLPSGWLNHPISKIVLNKKIIPIVISHIPNYKSYQILIKINPSLWITKLEIPQNTAFCGNFQPSDPVFPRNGSKAPEELSGKPAKTYPPRRWCNRRIGSLIMVKLTWKYHWGIAVWKEKVPNFQVLQNGTCIPKI